MTVDQFSKKLRDQILQIKQSNVPLFLGATTGVSEMVERVFVKGHDSYNRPIGSYSKTPIYVNPIDSPVGFSPRGKSGKSRFNNGKQHKTRYFDDGYRGFRRTIGRQPGFVNLRLTNDLQSDVSNNLIPKSSSAPAQAGRPTKINVDEYVIELRESNTKKVRGLERKYGTKIFQHTPQEVKKVVDVIEFELFKILND